MKYLNVVLTVIAVLLIAIFLKLVQLESAIATSSQNDLNIIMSNQGVIQSNQRLEASLSGLRQQIDEFAQRFNKK